MRFGILAFCMYLLAGTAYAQEVATETAQNSAVIRQEDRDAAEQLAAVIESVGSYEADFEQLITDPDGMELQRSSGRVLARKPGMLRWEILQPDRQVIIRNNDTLWRYEADLAQVSIGKFDASDQSGANPSLLLSGDSQALLETYHIEFGDGGFVLMPRQKSATFNYLIVKVAQNRITGLFMEDGFDQSTSIDFSQIKVNDAIPDAQFIFVVPDGVDVISHE